jgi:signal transduction histidine kinase
MTALGYCAWPPMFTTIGGVMVSVADTGTGIRPEDIERIFHPLFTTKSDGMGMGLSICRSIIESHGGQISVVPNKPQGSIFEFRLAARGADLHITLP